MAQNNNEFKVSFQADTKDYQKSMKAIDNESKSLTARLKLEQEQMRDTATAVEKIEHKQQGLVEQQKLVEKQIRATNAQHQRAAEMYGAESEEARKYEMSLVRLQTQQAKLANRMKDTEGYIERQNNAQRDLRNMLSLVERDIDSYADTIGQDMVNAIKSGRATTQQLERAIASIGSQAGVASQDMTQLGNQLRQLGNGANINQIRSDFNRLTRDVEQTESAVEEADNSLGNLSGVIAGAVAGVSGIGLALERELQDVQIGLHFDERQYDAMRDGLNDLLALGLEAEEAFNIMQRASSQNASLTDSQLNNLTQKAAVMSKLYQDIDGWELIQETGELGRVLGITTDQALDMMYVLMDSGFPPDQIDIVTEYGAQLHRIGYEWQEIGALMVSASKTGSWNIDNTLDGIKELTIRAKDFAVNGVSPDVINAVRYAIDGTKAATAAQIEAQQAAYDEDYANLAKNLDDKLTATQKMHQDATKSRQKEQQRQSKDLQKAQDQEMRQFDKYADARIERLDDEYMAKLRIADEEEYNRIKAIDAQIDAINAQQDAEDRAVQAADDARKRAELQDNLRKSRSHEDFLANQQALADFEDDLRHRNLREQRKMTIDGLNEQKDAIKDDATAKRDAIQATYDAQKEQLNEQLNAERELITTRHTAENEKMSERHALQTEQQSEYQSAYMTDLQARHQAQLDALKAEQDARIAHMTDPKLSAAAQAQVDKISGWLERIGLGDKTAAEELATYIKGIDNALAQESLGVSLFGTPYEDSGTALLDAIIGADAELSGVIDNMDALNQATDMYTSTSSVEMKRSLQETADAMTPLLTQLNNLVSVVANFVSQNPLLVGTLAAIGVGLTAIGGFVAIIQPIIGGLGTVVGWLVKVGGWIGRLAALLSPQGLIALAIIALVALIVKYWDEISAVLGQGLLWMSDMSKKAQDAVDVAATWIVDKMQWAWDGITGIFSGMGDFFGGLLTAPLNMFVEGYNFLADKLSELSITAPDWLPIIGGQSLDIELPKMQYFADGGVMTRATAFGSNGNRVYVGGEAGREAILPLRADVLAGIGVGIAQSSGLGDNNGNGNTYITYDAIFKDVTISKDVDVDALMQRIQRQIDKHNRGIR